jgi:hypothetical protein
MDETPMDQSPMDQSPGDHAQCARAIADVVAAGWALRDRLVAGAPINPLVVKLEESLHGLEQSVASLAAALSRLPSSEP